MLVLEEEIRGTWSRGKRALFPFDQIFENALYMRGVAKYAS